MFNGPKVRPSSGPTPRPMAGSGAGADRFAKESPFSSLFAKLARTLFIRVTGFASNTPVKLKFLFPEVLGRTCLGAAASPGLRRRSWASLTQTNTSRLLCTPRLIDQGINHPIWCSVKAGTLAAAGFGRGEVDAGNTVSPVLLKLSKLHT